MSTDRLFVEAVDTASRLGRAGRALRTTWTYWPDKGRRRHQIAYAVLHPHLIAYSLWLWATHSARTRSSR